MPEWLQQVLFGSGLLGLLAYAWRTHELHDRERNEHIWDQIGRDSHSGMRQRVHHTANVADASVKEIDELRRRVEQLEREMFERHGIGR